MAIARKRGILEIGDDDMQRWQDTSAGCYPAATNGPTFMGSVKYSYFTAIEATEERFEYLPSDDHARFERLDALPPLCTDTPIATPERTLGVFIAIFERQHLHIERRDVDWASLSKTARTCSRI